MRLMTSLLTAWFFLSAHALPAAALAQDHGKGLTAYLDGDYAAALREWMPLAERGDAAAQHNIGLMYDTGKGVPQDHAEAFRWYRKAARNGVVAAQYNLASMYQWGQGTERDYDAAFRWYRAAALQGDAAAQNELGILYTMGRGAPQDNVKAYMWWTIAAARGSAKAASGRDLIAKIMTTTQIAEARRLARDWLAVFARADD